MIHGKPMEKVESSGPLAEKKAWRARMRKERNELHTCPELHAELSDQLQRRLLASAIWRKSGNVLLYASMPDEVGTWLLLENAWQTGKRVFLPRCRPERRGEMEMRICSCREALIPSPMGILEPSASAAAFDGDDASGTIGGTGMSDVFYEGEEPGALIVVPGLAFDRDGYRIGYGGGYYDRLLGRGGLRSVGLVFSDHVFDRLPRDVWDIPVHGLCTEENLLWLQRELN